MKVQEHKRRLIERHDLRERIMGRDDMLSKSQAMGKVREQRDALLVRTSTLPFAPRPNTLPCGIPFSPKVISAKDIPRNDFKMYDAVLEDHGPALPPMDPEMEKFLPMLQDYLTRTHVPLSSSFFETLMVSCIVQESGGISNTNAYATSDDYVWDVFYRRPYSLSEWNSFAANYGTV